MLCTYIKNARRREKAGFKFGLVRVNCSHEDVPALQKDFFYAKIDGPNDPDFEKEAKFIYRGLLGLPKETPKGSVKLR